MAWIRDHIRSTFPVPPAEIRRRKWRLALRNPLTWLPALPLLGMVAGVLTPALAVSGVAITLGCVVGFWGRRSQSLEGKIIEEIIRDSNMEQDSEIIGLIRKLARNGYQSYAVTLGSFAALKTKIERALYQDEGLSPHKEQVGKLVDDLVFHVVDQLEEMAKIEYRKGGGARASPPTARKKELQQAWEDMSARVKKAYAALTETWHNLDVLIDPMPRAEASGERLDDTIAQLREENSIAEDVRRRVLADAQSYASLPPADAAAEAEIEATFSTDGELEKR